MCKIYFGEKNRLEWNSERIFLVEDGPNQLFNFFTNLLTYDTHVYFSIIPTKIFVPTNPFIVTSSAISLAKTIHFPDFYSSLPFIQYLSLQLITETQLDIPKWFRLVGFYWNIMFLNSNSLNHIVISCTCLIQCIDCVCDNLAFTGISDNLMERHLHFGFDSTKSLSQCNWKAAALRYKQERKWFGIKEPPPIWKRKEKKNHWMQYRELSSEKKWGRKRKKQTNDIGAVI